LKKAAWSIQYDPRTAAAFKKLDRAVRREILDYMDFRIATAADPRQFGRPLTGGLRGLWRYRVRDCRIICEIRDKVMIVVVVHVGHRRKVYDD
jgi:mRNA interferase RelE/StbE